MRKRKTVCPDCGKKVNSLGHHRRYHHAAPAASPAEPDQVNGGTSQASIIAGAAPLQPEPLPPVVDADRAPIADDGAGDEASAPETDALRAALGEQPEGPAGAGEVPAGPEGPVPPAMTPAALVQLAEAALYIVVRAACAAKRVPFDAQAQAAARLTKNERADLVALAPMATPYLSKQLQAAPEWTGAAIFGATFAFTATAHVRAATAPRELPRAAKAEPAPNGRVDPSWIAPGIPAQPVA